MMKYNKYKVLIITCWVLLALCCIIKLFGANLFIASTNNQAFIDFCNYVDNSIWYYIIGSLFNILTCSIYYMAVLKERKPTIKSLKWFLPLVCYAILKTIFYEYNILFLALDVVMMIGLPIVINRKTWFCTLIGFIAVSVFQLISVFLKLDHYKMFDSNTLVALLLSIDYIIMLVLFWLYRIKHKEVK